MSNIEHIKQILWQYAIPSDIFEMEYEQQYEDWIRQEESEEDSDFTPQIQDDIITPLTKEEDKELGNFIVDYYKSLSFTAKKIFIKIFLKTIKEIYSQNDSILSSNENRRRNNQLKEGQFKLEDDPSIKEMKELVSGFIDYWIQDNDSVEQIKILLKESPYTLFIFIGINNRYNIDEKTNHYQNVIDFIINKDFFTSIKKRDFFISLCKLNYDGMDTAECYIHGYDYIINRYFSFMDESKRKISAIDCYKKSTFSKTEFMRFSTPIRIGVQNLIKHGFNSGWINKMEFFEDLFKNNPKFGHHYWRGETYSNIAIRELADKEVMHTFSNEIYSSIPDNYSVIKNGYGIWEYLEFLSEESHLKNNNSLQILTMIKSSSSTKLFISFVKDNGVEKMVQKINEFKKDFPSIYKSTFEGKNPRFLNKKNKESCSLFEKVMIHMKLEKNEQSVINKKRL